MRCCGGGEAAAEEHRGALDEAIEDFGDDQGDGKIEKQQKVDADASVEGVDECEEDRSVDEVEAVGAFAEVVDGAAGEEAVKEAVVIAKTMSMTAPRRLTNRRGLRE